VLGRLAARHLVAPVVRVTEAARHIARTEDLGRRIEVTSNDEVGELATRFNAMLDTLERSIAAQRQLVADASHELRTPVTSLRTNIEVLAEGSLDGADRARLIADVEAQAEELSLLVADLIELARGDRPSPVREDVRLDALVAEAIERARRHAPQVEFSAALEPAVVDGVPDRLARAVNNLLDNAARHGAHVDVSAGPSGIVVRDDGPGIDPADLPHIFDRFYRGASARGRPGTGLGLAIVRQVAEQHGGTVVASNAEGGGAAFELRLPAVALEAPANAHV
jgi:two-component system sensor histidine kinase MprB